MHSSECNHGTSAAYNAAIATNWCSCLKTTSAAGVRMQVDTYGRTQAWCLHGTGTNSAVAPRFLLNKLQHDVHPITARYWSIVIQPERHSVWVNALIGSV